MFGIDERRGAAVLLRLGDGVKRQRRLARAFRTIDLDDPAARQAADPQRDIEPSEPDEIASTCIASRLPSFIAEPLPKARSICASAASRAFCRSMLSLVPLS